MSIHDRHGLTRVVNARGTFTPLGVSRSSPYVGSVVSEALGEFFVMDELQSLVSRTVADWTGAEAAAATHCVAAAITISVGAAMTGTDPAKVAALPDARALADRVVLPVTHAVNYGHPVVTDIRMAGAVPVLAGSGDTCSIEDLEAALASGRTACLLLVSSRLAAGPTIDLHAAVAAAHRRGVPAVIDAAAQDLRISELLATGADAVLVSAQKYLAAPTAGLIIGRRDFVQACRAQEQGIGRAMKATKEAMLGVLAAIEERRGTAPPDWLESQARKVDWFVEQASRIGGLEATAVPDPTGLPFSRVRLAVGTRGVSAASDGSAASAASAASRLADRLRTGKPPIWVMEHALDRGHLFLELVPLDESEMQLIIERLARSCAGIR